ncbi:rhodanese-related sulfurtransferase [Pseudoduganella flava]|uniref:Rhodanese-like domain-containing protein n=1 Tax=Pseudoduganella flava TaxID=871742 RepID=A0A562PN65_9BURK|nr:rhodanese-like domain-containing protein [Pseudoduganella flava]QGZ40470.1 rhodanese-like domain-containing protein [Pseudoduganella flava]TWI45911.1 rhodanese-related sulfurtransferase [Pseudoduganella flava]
MSIVTEVAAAPHDEALAHFERQFRFETDCWDVHSVMGTPDQDFVLLDVRGTESYNAGHVPGAVDLAHRKIIGSKLAEYPAETVFVTYCAGPHCNGAARAAIRLAKLGRPVKIMTGGITGWIDEGFALAGQTHRV